jgi:hypothetical protein
MTWASRSIDNPKGAETTNRDLVADRQVGGDGVEYGRNN